MLGASVNPEILFQATTKPSGRKHSRNRAAHRFFGMAFQHFFISESLESAYEARVIMIKFFATLRASHHGFFRVDYDYEIAHFLIRRVGDLVLSTDDSGCFRGHASNRFSSGINDVPFADRKSVV